MCGGLLGEGRGQGAVLLGTVRRFWGVTGCVGTGVGTGGRFYCPVLYCRIGIVAYDRLKIQYEYNV